MIIYHAESFPSKKTFHQPLILNELKIGLDFAAAI